MAKKVKVDQDLCISCSTCWVLDADHFIQGDDGKAKVIDGQDDENPEVEKVVKSDDGLEDAAASCPVGAISVEDEK